MASPMDEVQRTSDTRDVPRRGTLDGITVGFMLLELAVCVGVIALALAFWHWTTALVAGLVIATRQHALFILFHDAVHYGVARDKRLNDLVTNGLIGIPQLVPVQLYRRLHLAHHARLGSESDPERILLYRDQLWQYRPLPARRLARQILADLFLINTLKTLWHFERERRDPGSRLKLPDAKTWPEFWGLIALWLGLATAGALRWPDLAWKVALLWLVPLFTATQAIQKVRSFLEHAALPGSGQAGESVDPDALSYSWRPGLLGRLIVWPYHINYHREHHRRPRVPWHELPRHFRGEAPTPGPWWRILWDGRW